ncbi:hypothetical protein [Streptomyces sp. MMG1533]|uniref:hypothetical protein n=1 Tax=Streptomyces sp. MMG1533 TaxID=1415546 RepID=UPI00131C5D45|nr:hypothetical protein [Streptomyces sp. MMG1533]
MSNGSGALDVPDNNGDSNVDSVAVHTNAGVTLVTTLTAEGAHDAAVADLAPDGTAGHCRRGQRSWSGRRLPGELFVT